MDGARVIHLEISPARQDRWDAVLAAGALAQSIMGEGLAVGGTAAALYAGHRFSEDVDHLLPDLRERFDPLLETFEAIPGWTTARTSRPVLILGSLNGVAVGVRPMRRTLPVASVTIATKVGPLTIPTLEELIGMKAVLAYQRKAVRDFLDLAALGSVAGDDATLNELMSLDEKYSELQSSSIRLEVAKTHICAQRGFDRFRRQWVDFPR